MIDTETEHRLETDGIQYDILTRAIEAVPAIPGLFLEIGTRRGGSMQIIIDAALSTGQNRTFVSVDPYGNIPYNDRDGNVAKYDYTNAMKTAALRDLYGYAHEKGVNLITFTLTDREFFSAFKKGVPVYNETVWRHNEYAFAFLDGPHDTDSVKHELAFFADRMHGGAQIVIDNYPFFDLEKVVSYAEVIGFKFVEKNDQKIRLCKV